MPRTRLFPRAALPPAAILSAALLLAGCLPDRVTLELRPAPADLAETVVLADHERREPDSSAKVALIDVRGMLLDSRPPSFSLGGSGDHPIDSLVARLNRAAADPSVRAVILRINSPGGSVAASDAMHREVARFRERTGKPVIACMSELCASGGLYLALACDEMIALPSTVTASIGVIIQTINFSEGMKRFGIHARSVTSGPNKAMGSPFEPEQDAHYAILQSIVDEYYATFRALVQSRRPAMTGPALDRCTDGRIVTGAEAAALHLIDSTGDIHDAFASAKRLANLPGARLVKYHTKGDSPRTPYAIETPVPLPGAALDADQTSISLLQLNLDASSLPPGFYYLWSPSAP